MPFRRLRFCVLLLAPLTHDGGRSCPRAPPEDALRTRAVRRGELLAGVLAYFIAFGVWLAVVQPVNATVATASAIAPESLPQLWMTLRSRWEYGHAAGFVLELLGFASLLWSVFAHAPARAHV